MDIALNIPLNNVSFGQTSFALIKDLHKKNFNAKIFPIGNVDLSSQKVDNDLGSWIKNSIDQSLSSFSRKEKIFKLWHLMGSLESFSEKQVLMSFYELDSPTKSNNYNIYCHYYKYRNSLLLLLLLYVFLSLNMT